MTDVGFGGLKLDDAGGGGGASGPVSGTIPDNDATAYRITNEVGGGVWLNYSTQNGAEVAHYGDVGATAGSPTQHFFYSPANNFAFNVRNSITNRSWYQASMIGSGFNIFGNGVDSISHQFRAASGFVQVGGTGDDMHINLRFRAGNPALANGFGQIYTQFTLGNIELWYADQDGGAGHNFVQLTSVGSPNLAQASPPSVTGSRGGNAALASLLTNLATLGVITDNTTP